METGLVLRWCADCCAQQLFEVPPCAEGHGHDCPDLACTACGAAAVLGIADSPTGSPRDAGRSAA